MSGNRKSYESVREAMRDMPEVDWSKVQREIAEKQQALRRPLCEGGELYIKGECGACDQIASHGSAGDAEYASWQPTDGMPLPDPQPKAPSGTGGGEQQ